MNAPEFTIPQSGPADKRHAGMSECKPDLVFYIRGDLHSHYSGGIGDNAIVVLRTSLDLVDKFHS